MKDNNGFINKWKNKIQSIFGGISEELRNEIIGIVNISISLLILTSLIFDVGGILQLVVDFFYQFIGIGSYFLSLIFWIWGIEKFKSRKMIENFYDFSGWIILFFTVTAFSDIFKTLSGGQVGKNIHLALLGIVGNIGTIIVLVSGAIISLLLIFDILFSDALLWTHKKLMDFWFFIKKIGGIVYSFVKDYIWVWIVSGSNWLVKNLSEFIRKTFYLIGNHDSEREVVVEKLEKPLLIEKDEIQESKGFRIKLINQEEPVKRISAQNESFFEVSQLRFIPANNKSIEDEILIGEEVETPIVEEIPENSSVELDEGMDGDELDRVIEKEEYDNFVCDNEIESLIPSDLDIKQYVETNDENEDSYIDIKDESDEDFFEDDDISEEETLPFEEDELEEGFMLRDDWVDFREPSGLLPPINMLEPFEFVPDPEAERKVREKGENIIQTLSEFKVPATIIAVTVGPAVTQYEITIGAGTKVSKVKGCIDDIGLAMATRNIRIEAPIPGKSAIGIEVPNDIPVPVGFIEVAENDRFLDPKGTKLLVGLGKNIRGEVIFASLENMPHLLVAGSTGSGKSVCINTLICSILFRALPEEVGFIMVDPKMVELAVYNGIPHLMTEVITDSREAAASLNWAVEEMEKRYTILSRLGYRKLAEYNAAIRNKSVLGKIKKLTELEREAITPLGLMKHIVIIIDELADLMMVAKNEVETAICRIAQKARAVGIHLVIATQRPSTDVITGIIKANLPSRIAFAVKSYIDSRTILDEMGAERLLGKGDMLFFPIGKPEPQRIQGAYISNEEVERLVDFWKEQGTPQYLDEIRTFSADKESDDGDNNSDTSEERDYGNSDQDLVKEAVHIIMEANQASTSLIQRRLKLGYSRAARILDYIEEMGIIGPVQNKKPRDILVDRVTAVEILENETSGE